MVAKLLSVLFGLSALGTERRARSTGLRGSISDLMQDRYGRSPAHDCKGWASTEQRSNETTNKVPFFRPQTSLNSVQNRRPPPHLAPALKKFTQIGNRKPSVLQKPCRGNIISIT